MIGPFRIRNIGDKLSKETRAVCLCEKWLNAQNSKEQPSFIHAARCPFSFQKTREVDHPVLARDFANRMRLSQFRDRWLIENGYPVCKPNHLDWVGVRHAFTWDLPLETNFCRKSSTQGKFCVENEAKQSTLINKYSNKIQTFKNCHLKFGVYVDSQMLTVIAELCVSVFEDFLSRRICHVTGNNGEQEINESEAKPRI